LEDEIEVPSQNAVSEAIFQKYNPQQFNPIDPDNPLGEVIKEEDEENENETERNSEAFRFRIKNLDTGEEM
jgi:hypothetical protein